MILELGMWTLVLASFLVVGWLMDDQCWISGIFIWCCALVAGKYFLGWRPVLYWAWTNIWVFCGLYLLLGIAFALYSMYSRARKLTPKDFDLKWEDPESLANNKFLKLLSGMPACMAFWPPLLIWEALSEWLKQIFDWVTDSLRAVFRKVYDYATRDARAKVVEDRRIRQEREDALNKKAKTEGK